MNLGLILKLWPIVKEFIPKICKTCLAYLVISGVASWGLLKYVDAKHKEVTNKISSQELATSKEINNMEEKIQISLAAIADGIKDVKLDLKDTRQKIWQVARDLRKTN